MGKFSCIDTICIENATINSSLVGAARIAAKRTSEDTICANCEEFIRIIWENLVDHLTLRGQEVVDAIDNDIDLIICKHGDPAEGPRMAISIDDARKADPTLLFAARLPNRWDDIVWETGLPFQP